MPATEHFFRNQKKLHIVFAISCVTLLISVLAMMVEDYADPWRDYQNKNDELQVAVKRQSIEVNQAVLDRVNQRAELSNNLQDAEQRAAELSAAVTVYDERVANNEAVKKFEADNKDKLDRLEQLSKVEEEKRSEEESREFPSLAAVPGEIVAFKAQTLAAVAAADPEFQNPPKRLDDNEAPQERFEPTAWEGIATALGKKKTHTLTADDFNAFVKGIKEFRTDSGDAVDQVADLKQQIADLDAAQAADLKKLGLDPITDNLAQLEKELRAAKKALDFEVQIDEFRAGNEELIERVDSFNKEYAAAIEEAPQQLLDHTKKQEGGEEVVRLASELRSMIRHHEVRLGLVDELEAAALSREFETQIKEFREPPDNKEPKEYRELIERVDSFNKEYAAAIDAAREQLLDDTKEQKDGEKVVTLASELRSLIRHQEVQADLVDELDAARKKVTALAFKLKSKNADRDEKRADYDLGIRDSADGGTLATRLEDFGSTQDGADELSLELQDAEQALDDLSDPLSEINRERSAEVATLLKREAQLGEKQKAVEKLTASLALIRASLDDIDPEALLKSVKRRMMGWWILEGFNGQEKITQDWLPDLHQTLGMTRIARFDRCRTCHMNVDATAPGNVASFPGGTPSDPDDVDVWVEENKFPHPFATHPNHELFVTASSPHPVSTFGCTSCHDGQGSGVDFQNAEHGPNDPYQAEEWHHDHGYHPNHFWEYPMQPKRFQESTCIKCHHSVVELEHSPEFGNSAPTVTKGFNLMRKYGCFGCHEIHGFDGGNPIGPDMRLEPQTPEQAERIADDPTQVAGKFRKVGPSLRHVASKTTQDFITYWTQEPSRYRPTTKMPAPFNIRDHLDRDDELTAKFESVELAGIAKVLIDGSQEIDLLAPATGYQPNAERGKELFSTRGCLACHQHDGVPGTTAEFGPNITDIHRKVRRNSDDPNFSDWLYTWIKEPTRHHERTKMPNLFLDPYQKGGETVDPAADIAAWLLSQGKPQVFPQMEVHDAQLDSLVTIYLKKARFRDKVVEEILKSRQFPRKAGDVKGDEKVLATEGGEAVADAEEWRQRKLAFVGQKTIARYGCYGCHDIPGFEDARPIGVALQDWGRKDTSKLGVEHIEHFLHHHGEANGRASDLKTGGAARVRISVPSTGESANAKSVTFRRGDAGISVEDGVITISSPENMTVGGLVAAAQASPLVRVELVSGSADTEVEIAKVDGLDVDLAWSTADRVKNAMGMAKDGSVSGEELESELSHAYFYDSLLHHGRPGFLWQKLRAPRSYDYMKTETKGYDERLRMPKFPLKEDEIEAIATFILGLVADPPAPKYVYNPGESERVRIEGEFLLAKYNCTSCHMVELPEFTIAADLENDIFAEGMADSDHKSALKDLFRMRPPRNPFTGESKTVVVDEEEVTLPIATIRGTQMLAPDPEEDLEYQMRTIKAWETLDFFGNPDEYHLSGSQFTLSESKVLSVKPGRGGVFGDWLKDHIAGDKSDDLATVQSAMQASVPSLYQEGFKVQTAWLHQFLLDPMKIRNTTVLRMPKFNMSSEEARVLATYFAAVDGVPFFAENESRNSAYLTSRSRKLEADGFLTPGQNYLDQGWQTLNGLGDGLNLPTNKTAKCIGCHSVGGLVYKASGDPKEAQGPDLRRVQDRLRADWVKLWLYKPAWITPYTAMPNNFAANTGPDSPNGASMPTLFGGDPDAQVIGTRDALMNYTKLFEAHGIPVRGVKAATEGEEAGAEE